MKRLKTHVFRVYFLLIAGMVFGQEKEDAKEYGAVGLSAAMIEHYFFITESQLKSMADEKGGWAPIDRPTLLSLLEQNQGATVMVAGGSGANVIKGMAQLGQKCAIIGKVGSDDKGEYYLKRMKELGVVSQLKQGPLPTGQTICFVTSDGKSSFRTYLGESHSLSDLSIDFEIFKKARLLHIEGYQLMDPDLIIRTLKAAKENGVIVSMDLANVDIVRRNKEFIHNILDKYVNILFCNEKEAKELTGLSPSEACDKLSAFCDIAVVTMGERGSWARDGSKKVYMKACSVNAIDTTGAGELFASGFLHGYLEGESLRKCSWIGALIASEVVKRVGAEIPDAIWKDIKNTISEEGKAFD